jgi:tetratricopeptide (TPR) repeat protein
METLFTKSQLLYGAILKSLGRIREAARVLRAGLNSSVARRVHWLRANLLHHLADCYVLTGRPLRAAVLLRRAVHLLEQAGEAGAVETCHGHIMLGETLVAAGRVAESLEHYRRARERFNQMEMPTWSAYSSLLIASALMQMRREKEAAKEIVAALPLIEAGEAVPEGRVAVALLRESVRLSRVEPRALRELLAALRRSR